MPYQYNWIPTWNVNCLTFSQPLVAGTEYLWNLMYIMLLKVYNFSFSAVTVCTFNWPMVDFPRKQRWLIWLTTPAFRTCLIKKKRKYGRYNAIINVGNYSAWCMKMIWKWQCEFADSKINWCTGHVAQDSTTRSHLYVIALLIFHIVKK